MGVTLLPPGWVTQPFSFKIMLLSEDVKLKFFVLFFIKRHTHNQNLNRTQLLPLSRDMTGKGK